MRYSCHFNNKIYRALNLLIVTLTLQTRGVTITGDYLEPNGIYSGLFCTFHTDF